MRTFILAGFGVLLLSASPAFAQQSPGYLTPQQQAHAARLAEIRRHNYAQQEAIRLLFGPQGLPRVDQALRPLELPAAKSLPAPAKRLSKPVGEVLLRHARITKRATG